MYLLHEDGDLGLLFGVWCYGLKGRFGTSHMSVPVIHEGEELHFLRYGIPWMR